MDRGKSLALMAAAVMAVTCSSAVVRAVTIDGTLDTGPGGYGAILATQTNTSNVGQVPNAQADGERTPSQNQLSNAYGVIDIANNQLDVFFGGSIDLNDEYLHIAVDANPTTGVASLATGVHSGVNDVGNVNSNVGNGGNLSQVVFDSGFRPETFLTVQYDGGNIVYDDNLLTGQQYKENNFRSNPYNSPTAIGPAAGDPKGSLTGIVADDRSLAGTLETAATAASATTGFEIGLNLTDLGYVAGSPINVSAFITQGSGTSMTNQVLASNPGYGPDAFANYNFDFTAAGGPGNHDAPGNQYFTVQAPVAAPEPVSMGLFFVGGSMLIRRRTRSI